MDRRTSPRRAIRAIGAIATISLIITMGTLVTGASAGGSCDAWDGENAPTLVSGTMSDDGCLAGGNGPDILRGKSGSDVLVGGRGPDILKGGHGADELSGGQGPDTFICGPGNDVVHNQRATGADMIDDSCEVVL